MKKLVNLVCILCLSCNFFFAEQPGNIANKNTALRCLKLAENCLIAGDWGNAFNQSVLGLSYDESISDLMYVKAAAEIHLGISKHDVIEDIERAFQKNQWVGHTKSGARILYADLLSDVCRYEESMSVLDEEPFIFSADGEFIRIKNLYRMHTIDSVNDARLKVNSSRRVYKDDERFPNIFFMFELSNLLSAERNDVDYELPEIVKTIASSYISNLPDYKGDRLAIELMATFFASPEEQNRLLKAIDAKNLTKNPVLAIAGLRSGLYTEDQAFSMFFDMAGDSIGLGLLETFCRLLTENEVKIKFIEKLNNYEGSILIDNDLDLQPELIVKYEIGRPAAFDYDCNNDGVVDVQAVCDFGTPKLISINKDNININYSSFPSVSSINFDNKGFSFNYLKDEYKMSPVELVRNKVFDKLGLEFYIPNFSKNLNMPSLKELSLKANTVELPITERENSKVIYTILEGKPLFADFYQNEKKYAYCGFSRNYPFIRNVDQDLDGYFETVETFNISEKEEDYITDEEKELVKSIFNPNAIHSDVYLSKVQIDKNGNTFYEFTEEYLGLNGKITSWDYNDDGIIDCQYIKYPEESKLNFDDDNPISGDKLIKEDSIFFDENGEPYISINFINKIPVKMNLKQNEVIVYAGESNNFYWIEKQGSSKIENYIIENIMPKLKNGIMKMISFEENRLSVILVNDTIFVRIIPNMENDENIDAKSIVSSNK